MKNQITFFTVVVLVVAFLALPLTAGEWSISGEYAESCSCDVPCPCLFGSPPSKGHCDVNNYLEIEKGNLGDVSVDGVTVSMTGRLGKWAKFFFSESTTKEQADAVIKLLQKEEVFGAYLPETIEYLPYEMTNQLVIERSDGKVSFSTPATKVEIEVVIGFNGQPIQIKNFGMEVMEGHTQYKSVINSHKSDHTEFSYTGSNGLTSTFEISGN